MQAAILPQRRTFPQITLSPSIGVHRLDSLNFHNKTFLQIHEQFEGSISTEALKKLRAEMRGLWKVILKNSKKVKEPEVNPNAKLHEVLEAMLQHFEKIKHPHTKYFIDNRGTEFQIIERYEIEVGSQDSGQCIQTNFLPVIEKKEPALYKLIIHLFQYLHYYTTMGYMTEGYTNSYAEMAWERLMELFDPENDEINASDRAAFQKCIDSHKSGNINKISTLITTGRPLSTKEMKHTIRYCDAMIFKFQGAGSLLSWANKMIDLVSDKKRNVAGFDCYFVDEETNDGTPVVFSDYVGFIWSSKDWLVQEVDSYLTECSNNIGVTNPFYTRIWTSAGIRGKILEDKWPAKFYSLCKEFNDEVLPIIEKQYGITDTEY